MKIIITALIVLLINSQISFADDFKIAEKIQTKYGEIQILQRFYPDDTGPPSDITLKGKFIFHAQTGGEYIHLLGVSNFKNGQVVLFSQSCGGSGCRIDPLSFIVLRDNMAPVIITDKEFNSETYTINLKEVEGKVVVDLGYFNQKTKSAIFDGEKLYITLTDAPENELSDKNCKILYEASDGCARLYKSELQCEQFAVGYFPGSNADQWNKRMVSQYPGFNQKGLDIECYSACKTGELNDYIDFKNNVCIKHKTLTSQ